ncbi:MAG: GPMC system transcriptional regulator [Desulfuromonas sp.]|nr:GPMC system transcriptional regulator [Desulfuromonas sp.]
MATQTMELIAKINNYSKENVEEILHVLTIGINRITRLNRCRVYLEDLTSGTLTCVIATGLHARELRDISFPINTNAFLVSRVYALQEPAIQGDITKLKSDYARELALRYTINASYMIPMVYNNRSIGVLCVDSSRSIQAPDSDQRQKLIDFINQVTPTINNARKYHQQLLLARQIDKQKKKFAALHMLKSAVRLIDNLSLASVLIPSPLNTDSATEGLQILASYSESKDAQKVYDDEQLVSLAKGESLLSRYIADNGIIIDEQFLKPTYFPNLREEALQKRYLTEELGLKSLYVVPRYEAKTKRIICVVNYYTSKGYAFSEFERGLLEAHAEMAERVIQVIGGEHMEIQVLAEINDLLQERFTGIQPFLRRVLSKATELIGADTGSIAICQDKGDGHWLVVEDASGREVGAKSKEWRKKNIPPIPIGGYELPIEQRSLTGYAAHCKQPQLIANTDDVSSDGFYRALTENIKSELAVPIISEDKVLAVICLDSEKAYYFTGEHKRILQIVERMISRYLSDLQQIAALTGEVNHLRSDVGYKDPSISSYKLGNIIGNSPKTAETIDFIQTITPPLFNRLASWHQSKKGESTLGLPSILITGATGSGKEFVFNNIYTRLNEMYQTQINRRRELPLKKSNIAAYSGELTFSELFGHKRGAFTGAHTDRKGILEEAHGGVVFLDEIGDADPKTQVQLLRFLDNGGFFRLGENIPRNSRVLLVAATNKNLHQLIKEGKFREDLYHRLSELAMEVPSLNERREDIPDLSTHFLGKLFRVYKRADEGESEPPNLNQAAKKLLKEHHYTGNIRELRSILLRALFFRTGKVIDVEDIRRALPATQTDTSVAQSDALTSQLAEEIYASIISGSEDFWSAIYTPYSSNKISRTVVTTIIDIAKDKGANNMPRIATMLKVCDTASLDSEQKKIFYKFKNFLYKTIRIN